MFPKYRTEGFIFKERDFREADKIYSIFTKDFGRIEILGKAVRKISSKLRGNMALFSLVEIEFVQGKIYRTLTDVFPLEGFKRIRKSPDRLETAFSISEVIEKFIKGEGEEREIWNLILETFKKLNAYFLSPLFRNLLYYYFLWNFLSFLGYQVSFEKCVFCQKKINSSPLHIDLEEGGLVCLQCYQKYQRGKEISDDLAKLIRMILRRDLKMLGKIRVSQENLEELKKLSETYINFIGE